MNQSIRALREEHHWIQQLLDCLDMVLETSRSEGTLDVEAARELQTLFEHFVDEQHQGKEESALFPKLLECLQRLREDHATEREHLERMRFSLFNAALGDPAGREDFLREAETFCDLQRQHVQQENMGLLPLAEQLLSDEDDAEVLAEFRRLDGKGMQRAEVEARMRRLCERLGIGFELAAE